jgi:uncharacterized membrane protein (UPF0127 family)
MNKRTGTAVATLVELAVTRSDRRRGLLGRDALDMSAALVLAPCFAIHTMFMRFPIDVVFLNRDGRVRTIIRNVQPWRMVASPRAYAAVELAGGVERDLVRGDHLYLAGSGAIDLLGLPGLAGRN